VAGVGREHRQADAELAEGALPFAAKLRVEHQLGVGRNRQPTVGVDLGIEPGDLKTSVRMWYPLSKGMVEYRLGHFEAAIQWMTRSNNEFDPDHESVEMVRATANFYIAMAEQRLQHAEEAKAALAAAGLKEGERPPAEVKDPINERLRAFGNVRIAGRLKTPPRGNFVHLTDGMNKLQIYCKKGQFSLVINDGKDTLDNENGWTAWGMIDHGDFIGVEGYLFVTNTGEVSVHVEKLQFLSKAMLPMPDKMHGIADASDLRDQAFGSQV